MSESPSRSSRPCVTDDANPRLQGAPDQDGRERVALQVQQALRERGRAGLHAALVAGIDLEVVAVRAVQAQQPAAGRAIARVHHRAEYVAQRLRLRRDAWQHRHMSLLGALAATTTDNTHESTITCNT